MTTPSTAVRVRPVEILLVEDSGVDRLLTLEALRDFRVANTVHWVENGEEALDFLRGRGRHQEAPRPDLVLLDLNLPRKDGREVLAEIKSDPRLRHIPVVVLTTSSAEEDVLAAYSAHANCYITKPIDLTRFGEVLRELESFWFEVVALPVAPALPPAPAPLPGVSPACRVLLIEDSPSDALLLESALEGSAALRFETVRVERLEGALERLRGERFDIVVTDLNLPDSHGLETLRRVRRGAADTPVIVLTVVDDERTGLELLREGAQDCLVKGEIGGRALARSIRQAVDRAQIEERLRHAQRMESVGVLAGGVAHDFNNLLTVIRGNAELMIGARLDASACHAAARQIVTAAERGATLTRQLLTFGRRERVRPRAVELNATLTEFAPMLARLLGTVVQLEYRPGPEPLPLLADPRQIEQMVINLALNARDAMPDGGRFRVETQRVELDGRGPGPRPPAGAGSYALLVVRDDGPGIAPEVLPHVFEPFFTTKEAGRGTGLGLATVYGAVRQHRGDVAVRSEPGKGAEFRLWLPLHVASAAPGPAEVGAKGGGVAGGGATILLVDDDDLVRDMAASALRLHGFAVLEARDGAEVLSRWAELAPRVQLMLVDLVMPGLSGPELARRLRASEPSLKVVFSSGHGGAVRREPGLVEGVNFVSKPYALDTLISTVRLALHPGVAGSSLRPRG